MTSRLASLAAKKEKSVKCNVIIDNVIIGCGATITKAGTTTVGASVPATWEG